MLFMKQSEEFTMRTVACDKVTIVINFTTPYLEIHVG
jgi:hypothetical protein